MNASIESGPNRPQSPLTASPTSRPRSIAHRLRASWPGLRPDANLTRERAAGLLFAGISSLVVAGLAAALGHPDRVVSDLVLRGQSLDLTVAGLPAALVAAWLTAPYAARRSVSLRRGAVTVALVVVVLTDLIAAVYFTAPMLWSPPFDPGAFVTFPVILGSAALWGALLYGLPGFVLALSAGLPGLLLIRRLPLLSPTAPDGSRE